MAAARLIEDDVESLAGTCTDCAKKTCHEGADGKVYVICPTCDGRGTNLATETKTRVECANCGGAGVHRCRCLECHAESAHSTGWM